MSASEPVYNAYKGLQKPLVFKAFKGKYIYWGIGILVGSLVLGIIVVVAVSMLVGAIVFIGGMVVGLLYIATKQKKGLHSKDKSKGIFIITNCKIAKFDRT